MALLDRFRSLPATKHPDPEIRLAHVEGLAIDEREQIASFAREDESPKVRRAAVGKLMDPSVLALVLRDDADAAVRGHAASMLRDIALEAFEETSEADSLAAVEALADPKILSHVAKQSTRATVAELALGRIADARTIGGIARQAALEPIRLAAFALLADREELLAVAMNSGFRDTAVAAVDRLTDRADLEQIAERSNNKNAAKRARTILREADERAAAEQAVAEASASADSAAEHPADEGADQARRIELARFEEERTREETERARIQADAARQRDEQLAAERAASEEAAAERARQAAEQRHARLVELVTEIEAAAADDDLRSAKRRHGLVQREWRALTGSQAQADAGSSGPSEGAHHVANPSEAGPDIQSAMVPEEQLAARYAAAHARLTSRDADAAEADRRARREALVRLTQLLDRVELLAGKDDLTSKAAERALRDVRSMLGHVPPLPSKQDYDAAVRRLKAAQAALTPKLQEIREIEGWQRWANVGLQEQLCEKMEALASVESAEEIATRIRDLQQQWRQAADVPRAQGEALWQRFKKAHDEVWPRCEAHLAALAVTRADNLQKKITLCERAEALADSTRWIQTAEEIKTMQAEWKAIGPVSRGQEKAVWERFRAACDRFFTRRHDDLAERKTVWAENLAKKDALCVKAEALADSTDWDVAAAELKRLQAEWKTIGPVKKTRSEQIWQRFRAACDRFFARYAQRHDIARGERVAAREAICAELEAAAVVEGGAEGDAVPVTTELLATVRALRGRWEHEMALRGVEPARAVALDQRFGEAFARVIAVHPQVFAGTDLDPEANRQRMEGLVVRVEKIAATLRGQGPAGDEAISPTARLAMMLKEALAANTIGGKVDDDSRLRAAQEDMRQAQSSWSRIGPVPDAARRPLADRFARACRAISETAGRAAQTGSAARAGGAGRAGGPGQAGWAGRTGDAGKARR